MEYDLLSLVFIGLGKGSKNKMIKAMTDLLDRELTEREKRETLEKSGIAMMENFEEGVYSMCNIGQGWIEDARAEGREDGLEEGLEKGIEIGTIKTAINIFREDMHLSNEEIIEKLIVKFGITREEAKEKLEKY